MGKVFADITVANGGDEELASRGLLEPADIRSIHLDNVLVDTGATLLSLPAGLIERLGLRLKDEVRVQTATGEAGARRFRNALLTVEGRTSTFDCLELPGGTSPLLGVVPLEALGLEPDLQAERLRLLPETTADTHLTIL
jgi:predicted aspartyl protease